MSLCITENFTVQLFVWLFESLCIHIYATCVFCMLHINCTLGWSEQLSVSTAESRLETSCACVNYRDILAPSSLRNVPCCLWRRWWQCWKLLGWVFSPCFISLTSKLMLKEHGNKTQYIVCTSVQDGVRLCFRCMYLFSPKREGLGWGQRSAPYDPL